MAYTKYIVIKEHDSRIPHPPEMTIEYSEEKEEFYIFISFGPSSISLVCDEGDLEDTLVTWREMFKEAVNAIP